MEPIYMIPAFLRELISELSNPNLTEETREYYIEDVKVRFNETAAKLSMEERQNLHDYMEHLIEHITHSMEFLSKLIVEMPEESFVKIEENFIHHVLHDEQNKIADLLEMMNIALEVVNIGKDELTDYLPAFEAESSEKELKKSPEDANA